VVACVTFDDENKMEFLKTSQILKADGGTLRRRIVLYKSGETFVTHVQTWEKGKSSFRWGHYYDNLEKALNDFFRS
jgi:hypothetical protein